MTSPHGRSAADAATRSVVWLRLELHGFGRHRELDVCFGQGMTTLVAPNEYGKSTLAAGLAATVFGLPHLSDPTKFGRERFRGWHNPTRFEGSVRFIARDGARYELHRNFESHEVRIVRLAEGGAEQVFEGEHNPNARKGTAAFERHLERLLGMSDREAFRQSFHVAQPLPPPERLGEEVQRLLSGSGQGTFGAAVERLEEQIRERTSQIAALGVSSRDLRNDRRLQELEGRIAQLETDLREGRQAADEAKALGEELEGLQARRRSLLEREKALERALQAHRGWLDAKDAHEGQAGAHRTLKAALASARDLVAKADAATSAIEREWPEFGSVARDVEGEIVAAHEAERELADAEAGFAAAAKAVDEAAAMAAEAERAREAHRAEEPEELDPWDPDDLRALREQAMRAQRDWGRWCDRRAGVERMEEELARFATLERADDDTLQLLRDYTYERERLRQRVADEARAEAERRALSERRAAELQREATAARRAAWMRWAVAAFVALAVAVAVYLGTQGVPFAALAGLAAGGLTYAVARRRARSAADGIDATGHGLSAPDRWPADAPNSAGASSSGARSSIGKPPHPTGAPGPGHAGEPATAQGALDAFIEATRPFVESLDGYESPTHAVREWEDARRAVAEQRRLQAEHAESVWGVDPEGVDALEPATLSGSWSGLSSYATWRGASVPTVERLCDWLETQQPEAWERAIADAEDRAGRREEWMRADEKLDRAVVRAHANLSNADQARAQAAARLERVQIDESAARAAIEDLLERTGRTAADLLQRWRAYREAVRDRADLRNRLAGLLAGRDAPSIEALGDAEYEASMEVLRIANRVEDLRAEHPELPPLSDPRGEVAARWRELERERERVAAECDGVQQEIFGLTQRRAGLAGKSLVNIAQAELEVAELRSERAVVAAEVEALALARRELQAAVSDFQASYRGRLEGAATAYLQRFSGAAGRRVALGEEFEVGVVEPDGTRVHPGQLSQGAQDQLLLALRLAVADHLSADAPLPLILDDPFLNWDRQRLAHVEVALRELARERQIVLLSHRGEFAGWGEPVEVR